VTIPAEGIGRGLAAIVAAIAEAAERDADDRVAVLDRWISGAVALRRRAVARQRRMNERGADRVARVRYDPPGRVRPVRLSASDLGVVIERLEAQRDWWRDQVPG
jgi:hypothetical protein